MMRLRRLALDAFGHFAGKNFDFGEVATDDMDLHVIHGVNEAGKSTTMEAFLRLLYGFDHREHYDFRHGRPNLRVSADLEIDGRPAHFVRLPTRKRNLVDAHGEALPESAISRALGGLSQADYRKLFCLNDDTIESGGEEIVASRGDIGRLLFSAAAGLEELTPALEIGEARASAFFRKGASKTTLAALKRELTECTAAIAAQDVSADAFRRCRRRLAEAERAVAELRTERRNRQAERLRLDALVQALPVVARIRNLERELAPYEHYPASLDIDSERLVGLIRDRDRQFHDRERQAGRIRELEQARAAIQVRPELAAMVEALRGLRGMRDRAAVARETRPGLIARRGELDEDIAELGASLGLPVVDTGAVTPTELQLEALEARAQALERAEQRRDDREAEHREAEHETERLARQVADLAVPERHALATLLERHAVDRTLAERHSAEAVLAQCEATLLRAREAIGAVDVHAGTLPEPSLSSASAETLVRDIDLAEAELHQAEHDRDQAMTRLRAKRTGLAALEAESGAPSAETAARSRRARDSAWQAHRAALDDASADAFERALDDDDVVIATRLAAAATLGEIRLHRATLAEQEVETDHLSERVERARARRDALQRRLADAITASGFDGASVSDFAAWIRHVETAAEAERDLAVATRKVQPDMQAGTALCEALRVALDEPAGELDALVVMARERLERHASARERYRAALDASERAGEALARRARLRSEADSGVARARADWRDAVRAALGEGANEPLLRTGLAAARQLRQLVDERKRCERSLDGDRRDTDAFVHALAATTARYAMSDADDSWAATDSSAGAAGAHRRDDDTPEARYDALLDHALAAAADLERVSALEDALRVARAAERDAGRAIDAIDTEVSALGRRFDGAIATDTIDELRVAVDIAQRMIATRERRDAARRELVDILGVADPTVAIARLDDQTLDECRAERDAVVADVEALDARLVTAHEELATARARREAITGGADVATLRAERQTLLVEIENGARGYLEDRLGHLLAERAIRRYRERHRSTMMERAEHAFVALTDGAYTRLEARDDSAGEVLVAVHEDGTVRTADTLSKGTRFQLYLALRAAAYERIATAGTVLPFFCDDVFETFDESRTRAACRLMARIAVSGQAIYLTHHAHVVDIAREVCGAALRVHSIGRADGGSGSGP